MATPALTADEIKNQISRMVDDWVKELLSTGEDGPIFGKKAMDKVKPRGMWDRFKGGISNLVYGRSGANNPYLHKNQFGDYLGGVEESFNPSVLTLSEYTEIRSIVENAEKALNEAMDSGVDKLRIVTLIRGEAEKLKQRLMGIFATTTPPGPSSSSSSTAPPKPSSSSSAVPPGPSSSSSSTATPKPSSSSSAVPPGPSSSSSSTATPKPSSSSSAVPPGAGSSTTAQAKDYKKILKDAIQAVHSAGADHGHPKRADNANMHSDYWKPSTDWLTKSGRLKRDKVANAIRWLATIPNKKISDEDFEKAFKASVPGVQFNGFEWKGQLGNSLISALRTIYLPVEDRNSFEEALRNLGVDPQEANVAEAIEKIDFDGSKKKGKASSATGTRPISPPSKEEDEPEAKGTPSKLYADLVPDAGIDGLDQEENKKLKSNLMVRIEDVLIIPVYEGLDEPKQKRFYSWYQSFAKGILGNDKEGLGSLLASIKSGALLDEIAKNSGGSKKVKDLVDMIEAMK
jgi:hypothetical protein